MGRGWGGTGRPGGAMIGPALVAALGVALLLGPDPARRLARMSTDSDVGVPGSGRPMSLTVLALTGAALVGAALGMRALGWFVIGGIAAGTVGWLLVQHRRRAEALRSADEVARAARVLASLMRAGQIPTVALAEAAEDCPVLARAASGARLGADVGDQLAGAASAPGMGGMALIAAAWRVSERSGAPVADVLAGVAENLRRERRMRGLVEAELAAARSTGHIMAALPFLAILLGFAAGADPLRFLFGEAVGQLLVLGGVVLTAAGVLWIDRLARPRGFSSRGGAR